MNITCFSCKSPRDKVREMVSFSDRRDLYLCNECIDLCHEITHEPEAAKRAAMEQDAARYRWLRDRMLFADFDYNGEGRCMLAFELPPEAKISSDCDETINYAMVIGVQP